jgi:hypothetical protein
MNRKIVFTVLALLLAVTAFAQTEADFTVTLTEDGEGVVITKYIGKVAAVRIPATIQGMPVREIGDEAFRDNYTITSVVIPEGVTRIGQRVFFNNVLLSKLTTVTLPKTLTAIGDWAFAHTAITAVTLPGSLIEMGQDIFCYCSKLKMVTLSEGITEIPWGENGMFGECTALTTVTLPSTLTSIGKSAFSDCESLTSIALPASIEKIWTRAFQRCSALTTITIPATVEKIEFTWGGSSAQDVFEGCSKLPLATQAALKRLGYTGKF